MSHQVPDSTSPPPPSVTGTIDFKVGEEVFQTWYRVYGDLKQSHRRPLVILHWGPGIPSFYLEPFSDLVTSHGIPVIIYDQLGCGNSTHLKDKDASFWTENLFLDQLQNLLEHFGIQDDFDLAGHSWGGMLCARFAGSRKPKGLKHLIIANSPARMKDWVDSSLNLLKRLPQELQDTVNRHELEGTTDDPEYLKALGPFFDNFLIKVNPHPKTVQESIEGIMGNPTVRLHMWGPTWIRCTGNLKDWSVIDDLPSITAPTLIYNGRDDQAQDFVVAPYFKLIPRVKWVRFENASHTTHHEQREGVMKLVSEFLTD